MSSIIISHLNLQMTKEVTCSGQRKPGTCFVPEELQVTYSDPEEPRAICFDQEDLQTLQRKLRDTYSVLVELHPIYFDPEKPQVICFVLEEPQAISSDQKNLTENKVEATFSAHEKPRDTYFARGALRGIFLGLDGRNKQVRTVFLLCSLSTSFNFI